MDMNRMRIALAAVCLLALGALASLPVHAQRGGHGGYRGYSGHGHGGHGGHSHWRGSVGFYFGAPLYAPYYFPSYYYPSPYYYSYPSAVYGLPATPPVYVERSEGQAPAESQPPAVAYWYFCPDSNAYYPYVRECSSEWQR
jgi:hypothetical protein